jgi:hypothetical protein
MPIPVWVPIALAAASMGANTLAQRKVDKASEKAYRWVEANNDKNIEKAKAAALKTEDLYKNQQVKEAAEAQRLSNVFTETKPVEQALSAVGNAGTTDAIVAENNRQQASTKRYTDMVGNARANLLAGNYVLGNNARASMDNATDIARALDFMKGDSAVFNTKLQNAQTKGQTLGTIGDLLSMGSMLTGMGAMMAPAGAAAGAGNAANLGAGASSVGSQSSLVMNPLTKLPYPPML